MKTEINRLKDQLNPVPDMMSEIESGVMESVRSLPAPAVVRSQHQQRIVIGTAAAAVFVFLILFTQHPEQPMTDNRDFTESRIILPDHTSIWLTPVHTNSRK